MSFGGQSVTLVSVTSTGERGYLGMAGTVRAETVVDGCRARLLSADETEGSTDLATERWKFTLPPTVEALAVRPSDEVVYGGRAFRVDGPVDVNVDMDGTPHHVTIVGKLQHG